MQKGLRNDSTTWHKKHKAKLVRRKRIAALHIAQTRIKNENTQIVREKIEKKIEDVRKEPVKIPVKKSWWKRFWAWLWPKVKDEELVCNV